MTMIEQVKLTHFCHKCGWIDDIEVAAERVGALSATRPKKETQWQIVGGDNPRTCPECSKQTALPLNMANAPRAIGYLLRALR